MSPTRTETDTDAFATSWLQAWNTHDIEGITNHYRDDVEYYSPYVSQLLGTDTLHGRAELRAYVVAGLERFPDLHLGPMVTVGVGVNSVAMVYWSLNGVLAIETLVLDDDGLIARAYCHYRADTRVSL